MGTHHEQATSGKRGEPPAHQFPEPSLYPVANHRRANRTANNKAYLRTDVLGYETRADSSRCPERVAPPARRPERITRLNSSALLIRDCCGSTTPPASRGQARGPRPRSDGDLLAALAAARGKDGAASTGTHALTEAVDLGPPAVVRLERALAHWNSRSVRKLRCLMKGGHAMRRAPGAKPGRARRHCRRGMGQPVNGKGDPRAGQTELLPGSTIRQHHDFHNGPAAGDLGCGKSRPADRHPGAGCRRGMGKLHCGARTHLVDEPVDNELRLAVDPVDPVRSSGNAARARGAHRE